jgi:hypothetical protein
MMDLFQMPIIDREMYEEQPISLSTDHLAVLLYLFLFFIFLFFFTNISSRFAFSHGRGSIDRPPALSIARTIIVRAGSRWEGNRERFFALFARQLEPGRTENGIFIIAVGARRRSHPRLPSIAIFLSPLQV